MPADSFTLNKHMTVLLFFHPEETTWALMGLMKENEHIYVAIFRMKVDWMAHFAHNNKVQKLEHLCFQLFQGVQFRKIHTGW